MYTFSHNLTHKLNLDLYKRNILTRQIKNEYLQYKTSHSLTNGWTEFGISLIYSSLMPTRAISTKHPFAFEKKLHKFVFCIPMICSTSWWSAERIKSIKEIW
jgi:hypothetical protein